MKKFFAKDIQLGDRKLYIMDHPKAYISEAFRMLRTNLIYTNVDKEIKILMITSSGPQEGKSTVVSNLAAALAQTGKKVLLMDCDLRKPVQHEVFELSNEVGLTKYITGYCSLDEAVRDSRMPNLQVLTSGPIPPNPAELIGSKSMDRLLELVKDNYEIVLIDAPPAIAVADPIILAGKCDGVIVVVRAGLTKLNALKETKELLKKAEAPVIGTVLNDSRMKEGYYYKGYRKYYQQYYRHYYEE
ncbi:MAG: CpsD/CapB family tyrosine-protein kinase [Dehalobacterium sp.]